MPDPLNIVCPQCNAVNNIPPVSLRKRPKCGKCGGYRFTGYPIVLDTSNFRKHISRSDIPVIVDFWASWSEESRAMAPVFALAASRLEPRVRLAKVNRDAEQEIVNKHAILTVPTVVIFRKGKEIDRDYGPFNLTRLLKWIKANV